MKPPKTSKGPKAVKKLLIVAGNFHQFREYIRREGIDPQDARFIQDRFGVYGFTKDFAEPVYVGTWYNHPKLAEIEEALSAMHS